MTKTNETPLQNIAVADLHYTPDRRDQGDLKALAASIKEHGLQVPLVVCKRDYEKDGPDKLGPGMFTVLDGRRRLEAFKLLGLEKISCIVAEDSNPDISLIINTHRLALSPIELLDSIKGFLPQALGCYADGKGFLSPEEIKSLAAKVNLSIEDTLKLLTLHRCSDQVKDQVHTKKMPLNVAILTAHLDDRKLEAFLKYYLGARPSYRDAKRWFRQNRAALELREAIFPTGNCKDCQFHGDQNPALFDQDELKAKDSYSRDDDRCFNPQCWKSKEAEFRQAMKEKAAKQGVPKAGLSTRDLWDTDGMVHLADAARIISEPNCMPCADCKLVKWYKGNATKGKWVLFCPTACPNIKQPKGKKAEPSYRQQVSIREKLEKNLPLSPAEKQQAIYGARKQAGLDLLAEHLGKNLKKLDTLSVLKIALICGDERIPPKLLTKLAGAKLEDLHDLIAGMIQDYNYPPDDPAMWAVLIQIQTGDKDWIKHQASAIDAALPPEIKALLGEPKVKAPKLPAKAKKAKK